VRLQVDAQLPARLASLLVELGHDAVHTSALPDGNRTTDQQVAVAADEDGRTVVSKGSDFRHSTCWSARQPSCWSWPPATYATTTLWISLSRS
jgi:predicted nuclease of predicted toxin-antitoxin system